ncbi:hypothetical protein [Streptomyces sp. NRRL F-5065]|nr:hypothetical protein [Streptomyces sp. NRRL F-5065]
MPKKPPPPTYVDQLLSELTDIETRIGDLAAWETGADSVEGPTTT